MSSSPATTSRPTRTSPKPPELQELQAAHRQRLTSTGQDYNPTASIEQLDQKIRSLQLKVERLTDELQQVDQKVDVHGGRLRRWLVGVAVLVIAGLGTLGYVGWRQQVGHRAQQEEQRGSRQNAKNRNANALRPKPLARKLRRFSRSSRNSPSGSSSNS